MSYDRAQDKPIGQSRGKQKITPFLWFDTNAEEAINYYTSLFDNPLGSAQGRSQIMSIQRYPEGPLDGPMKGMEGKVMNGIFTINGMEFMALDGGPQFAKTPAISFSVNKKSVQEVEALWEILAEGGQVLMELNEYPFSKKYGWLNDKYGVSWQISVGEADKITPSFLYVGRVAGRAKEAMELYTSLFKDSKIETMVHYEKGEPDKEENLKFASFKLAGQDFIAMDSSLDHQFTFTEGVSLFVRCKDQGEVDYYWDKLTAEGGEESRCGWLKDKYGVSWQIIPDVLGRVMSDSDTDKAGKVMHAMMQMKKIVVADLEKAYEGK